MSASANKAARARPEARSSSRKATLAHQREPTFEPERPNVDGEAPGTVVAGTEKAERWWSNRVSFEIR